METLQKNDSICITEVWSENLGDEFGLIRNVIDNYPYISIVLLPGNFLNNSDYDYQNFKTNIDKLKPIQLGFTFSDKAGNLPTCGTNKYCICQFNFREFSLTQDFYATDSIELMRQSKIDFDLNNEMGIDANSFAELLMSSGMVLNEDVRFITFHGVYDFGYLLKLLTGKNLPDSKTEFLNLFKIFFPELYDIKHLMMEFCHGLHSGLDLHKLAEILGVERIGNCRHAGSNSLLTSATFKKMKETFFHGSNEKYAGVLWSCC